MEYCSTRLAAWLPPILLIWLVIAFCNALNSHRRSRNPSPALVLSQEPLKPQKAYTTANTVSSIDHYDFKSKVTDNNDKLRRTNPTFRLLAIMVLFGICGFLLLGHLSAASSLQSGLQSIAGFSSQAPNSTGLQEFFQLYSPISLDSSGNGNCDVEILLMDHVFGASYGAPFVGNYEPPNCGFDTQFDRLALMYLGDNEVFRTSTAEPTTNGIVWTYIKEMSQYNSLWKSPQKLIFDLGNIINDVYTGSFNTTLTAHFSKGQNVETADMILPISAKKSASNSPSAFQLPTDNTTVMYEIPAAASRAVVSISACGQSEEEFWWSNVFSQDTQDFESTVGGLYGYTPFREVQLYIDGILAGLVWPFPIIFTGGVAPGYWRPVVGTDAFDLRQPEIDISPFLPMVQDGKQHSFEIRVTGLNVSADGKATFANTVGSYWVVTGNIFIYIDDNSSDSKATIARDKNGPMVDAPLPVFAVTRNLRVFSVKSSLYSWSQTLLFSNHGLLNQQGYSQVNRQLTTGNNTITELGDAPISNSITFQYPLVVNATYGITSNGMTIDSWMMRGLDFESTGGLGISTYTSSSGPSYLHASQSGTARYKSITGGSSSSWGDTTNVFKSQMNGQSYHRSVHAVNGTVVSDTDPEGKVSASSPQDLGDTGRGSEIEKAHVFEMKDEHPRIVEAMIRSFYGLHYDINQPPQMCPLLFNVKVHAIADKFEVEYLKIQAKLTFVTLAQDYWNSDEFLTAAFEAYTTTPKSDRGLRDVVVAVCQKHRKELRERKAFEKLVEETPGLATDIVLLSHRWLPQSASTMVRLVQSFSCLSCFAKWQIQVGLAEDFTTCPFCQDDKVGAF
ncbi:hypothetical protein N7519_001862 [Penicillium mononematosum]|uniref:uncharacterized protein n=1 Tax=Penicillium mononematosum TaxID=268346 RepID=UPI0025499CA4|nr:uncharacterized protein N7519_001862 [Penicillium mononematosum]KAJ6186954.1 hypothetical protein N7519_001862 [Penicillium mononematosum]